MKFIVCIFALCVAVQAFEIDWDNVRHKIVNPPSLVEHFGHHEGRIVGGQEAMKHQFPYQVAIFFQTPQGQYFCGGSLISQQYVLTAAHCADDAISFQILLGAHNIRENEPSQVKITTNEKIVHPDYDSVNIINDIALIKLPQPVALNENIKLARLPSRSQESNTFADSDSTVSGWGRVSDQSSGISNVLKFVSNPIITNEKCEKGMLNLGLIKDTNICQSGKNKKSACSGDSGGPLTVDEGGSPTEVGIVSFGLNIGCEKGIPGAYTRITKYLDWIEQNSDVKIRP